MNLSVIQTNSRICNSVENLSASSQNEKTSGTHMDTFVPFISDGYISLIGESSSPTPIKILRDTGASQSLVLANALPFSEKSSSFSSVLIKGVGCPNWTSLPLHNVLLCSDLVKGPIKIAVSSSLPFKGIHLVLGNDLAGYKVVANPIVTDKPSLIENTNTTTSNMSGFSCLCSH